MILNGTLLLLLRCLCSRTSLAAARGAGTQLQAV